MLYLKSMSLSKFKSFKHAELLFSKGFTCVVGPNGSGKSNICDALLFGLGESSLKRLRVDKLDMLINSEAAKSKGVLPKAYVKIILGGDEELEVLRVARADGKSLFRINGKHMSRQEATEVLKKYMFNVDETNTITQGEINKMMELNPKERRELIDIAAGIKEFDDKKAESLKELDRVSVKIGEVQIMLNERLGFLKELEKEKEAAEEFARLSQRKKVLGYSILSTRKELLQKDYDNYSKELAIADQKKQQVSLRLSEISDNLAKLSSSRQAISRKLNESTIASGDTNRKVEAISNEVSALAVEINNYNSGISEATKLIETLGNELAKIKERAESAKSEFESNSKRIAEIDIPDAEVQQESDIKAIQEAAKALGEEVEKLKNEAERIDSSIAASNARLEEISKEIDASKTRAKAFEDNKNKLSVEVKEFEAKSSALSSKQAETEKLLSSANSELDDINSKLISIREQLALYASRDSGIESKIKAKFGEKDGFYGRAASLCTYDTAYAVAIDASARNRLDYFVVEDIKSASNIIEFLKKNGLGRATFIPLKEIVVGDTSPTKELSPLITFVKFDEKYRKAFEYIFSNTYIIDDINNAKKYGIGKRRYVTLEGELVEQSGILSGGASRRPSAALLESTSAELEKRRRELSSTIEQYNSQLFEARKQNAATSMQLATKRSELTNAEALLKQELASIMERESSAKSIGQQLNNYSTERSKLSDKISAKTKELNEAEQRVRAFYESTIALSRQSASNSKRKELAKELEKLKVRNAELGKEIEMLSERSKEIEKSIKEKKEAIVSYKSLIEEKTKRKLQLEDQKLQLEEVIKSSGAESKRNYEELEKLETKITEASGTQGRLNAELESVNRRMSEIQMKRSQIETKLADVEAERQAYTDVTEVVSGKIEDMEREAAEINIKINALGAVNMKAPEIYAEKKKEVEDAQSKMEVLGNEKDAVMRMIAEVDSKKQRVFMETFNIVNKNFSKLYNYIFPGKATIELENPSDIFNSGLYIKVNNESGSMRLNSLSGGEKSLIMLMLIFAIHMSKLSSIYIFDEVDQALDKENSRKLSLLIKEMSKESQFIVVSHNDSLISNADAAIGVAKTSGESRAVGIQVSNILSSKAVTQNTSAQQAPK